MKNIDIVFSRTHSSEYLLHKYWARKPHNVIAHFLTQLVPPGGLVIDPFFGSGVVLRESQIQGLNAIGFDINPVANKITNVLINPPDAIRFHNEITIILDDLERRTNEYYTINGKKIRYLTHLTQVKCDCGKISTINDAIRKGRNYYCAQCSDRLYFNLENLYKTTLSSITFEKKVEFALCDLDIEKQERFSNTNILSQNDDKYVYQFVENKRILAFAGLKTSDLFTRRNFSVLREFADQISKISEEKSKNAAELLLTASVAQCSRLIPARNDLSTGGPAWTVPGFWVPAEHLETNPIIHLRARLEKFTKGINELNKTVSTSKIEISEQDAIEGLKGLNSQGTKADLVFFDPPYGDSIPYLEFSAIWNSFLQDFANPDLDMSVSDRINKSEAWLKYSNLINQTLSEISKVLKPNGFLLVTFNNNDLRAWKSLLSGLQENCFRCKFVTYQFPAVISSKAQFSKKGSYISDIYSVFDVDINLVTSKSIESVYNALIKCAISRNGSISKQLAQRVAIISWMRNNIDSKLLDEKDTIIKSLFTENKDGVLILKNKQKYVFFDLQQASRDISQKVLQNGPCSWLSMYQRIAYELDEYGLLEPNEVMTFLEGFVVFENERCLCINDQSVEKDYSQLDLGI